MFAVALLLPQPSIVAAKAPAKPHLLTFGKAMEVKWFVGPSETKTMALNVRPFYVDGRLREFTLGDPHDVTDHLFVVRRAFRVNDALPQDARLPANWRWQRGGWLLVDRSSGHISPISLPYFDPFYSAASWYRDYVAYCGLADDGEKLYAVVAELGRKKPLVRKELGAPGGGDMPDSECPAPTWQRQPSRVSFEPRAGQKVSFAVRGHSADLAEPDE